LKHFREFVVNSLIQGVLVVLPIYLTALLLLKLMKSLGRIVRPLDHLLPKWVAAETVASVLLLLILCFLVGIVLRTRIGQATRTRMENSLLEKIPGYTLFRGMAHQMAGDNLESTWKPALAEIEQALVPAFIIEELNDGRYTVFIPAVPTPMTGAVYILSAERVHPLNVPFPQALRVVTRWGAGSKHLVAAMQGSGQHQQEQSDVDCLKGQ
jgi:uncharacterized membrane protein